MGGPLGIGFDPSAYFPPYSSDFIGVLIVDMTRKIALDVLD